MANSWDLSGLPMPLWVAESDQSLGTLLPEGCEPLQDRRTWLLALCTEGSIPILRGGKNVNLIAGSALLCRLPDNSIALRRGVAHWQSLCCAFAGYDDLIQDLLQRQNEFRLPLGGWAHKQLQSLAQTSQGLEFSSAWRLVSGLLINLIEHNLRGANTDPQTRLLRQAVGILDASVEEPISLAQVADRLGITQSHLSRVFKEGLGTSPRRYLQDRRMRRACALLRGGDADIASIAKRLCYDSAPAFSTAFRAAIGMTPSDYRNSRSVPLWDQA